jgi:PAS domain S-box-containing protein
MTKPALTSRETRERLMIFSRRISTLRLSNILIAIGLLIAIASALSIIFFISSLKKTEISSITNRLEVPAQAMANVAAQLANAIDLALQDISAETVRSVNVAKSTSAMHKLLGDRTRGRRALARIDIYGPGGKLILSSDPYRTSDISVAEASFFKRQKANHADELIVSERLVDPSDRKETIILSRPILDNKGGFHGVAAAFLNLNTLQSIFDSVQMPPGATIALFSRTGRMLVRTPRITLADQESQVDFTGRPAYESFRSNTRGAKFERFTVFTGVDRFIAGVGFEGSPFIVTAGWDAAPALAHWHTETRTIVGASISAAMIMVGLFIRLISQARRTERLLREVSQSEKRLRDVLGGLPDAVLIYDAFATIEFANPAAEELAGFGPGEMAGIGVSEIMSPSEREADCRAIATRFEAEMTTLSLRRTMRRKDGSEVVVDINARPYESAGGRKLISVLRDVSERQRYETMLRLSREDLARAQAIASVGSFSSDLATGKIEWSEEFVNIWGLQDAKTITGKDLEKFVHPEDREAFTQGRIAALKSYAQMPLDFRITRPDGQERILHREYGSICDESGAAIRLFGTVQDITERKRIEVELFRSRENMAQAQRIAALGSFERDARTGASIWSDELYRIFGLEKGSISPGWSVIEGLIHPDDRDKISITTPTASGVQNAGPVEFRIIRPDGVERVLRRESGVVRDKDGRPTHFYGTYQDITELRETQARERALERQLLHSQKLEALGTLAGGIAHDLNNTLVPIMALSKLAARETAPDSTLRGYMLTIYEASEHARDLVKRVLAFSRRDEPEKKDVDLAETIGDVLKLLRPTLPSSIELRTQIANVPLLRADASQIHQVATNLVTNAVHAIGGAVGKITVRLYRTKQDKEEAVCLSVLDTGCGMSEATQQRIFEPFFTTKSVGSGTGLGLSIVHGIILRHGGTIEVKSSIGAGTEFLIYLPLDRVAKLVA